MSYMWNEFNIKTPTAETIVYRDGVYCGELSTLPDGPINKTYNLPVHIIYIGEIAGKCRLDVDVGAQNQTVLLDVRVKNKKPAFFNISIKNAGKNSEILGQILLENSDTLTFDCKAHHLSANTGILVQTNLIGGADSVSKLSGASIINKDCDECVSDIAFGAMCDKNARVEFMPAQYIASIPTSAGHSASLYTPSAPQILYLRGGGLGQAEVDAALRDAFRNKFTLF